MCVIGVSFCSMLRCWRGHSCTAFNRKLAQFFSTWPLSSCAILASRTSPRNFFFQKKHLDFLQHGTWLIMEYFKIASPSVLCLSSLCSDHCWWYLWVIASYMTKPKLKRVGRNHQVIWQREWGRGGEDNSEEVVKYSHESLLLNLPASLPVLVMSQYQRKLCFPWATLLFLLSGWISYFILRYGQQEAYGQTAAHLYLMTIITISNAYLIPAHIWLHHIFSL